MEREVSVKICRQELIWYVSRVRYNPKLKISNPAENTFHKKTHVFETSSFSYDMELSRRNTKPQLVADPNPDLKNRLRLVMNKF